MSSDSNSNDILWSSITMILTLWLWVLSYVVLENDKEIKELKIRLNVIERAESDPHQD